MRNRLPFTCPRCGDGSAALVECHRCRIPLRDQAGHPNIKNPVRVYRLPNAELVGAGTIGAGATALAWAYATPVTAVAATMGLVLVAASGTHGYLRAKLHDRSLTKAAERRIERAGEVVPIARASGYCRVRGKARVLVPAETSRRKGAVLTRVREKMGYEVEFTKQRDIFDGNPVESVTKFLTRIVETTSCGRFAVIDDTGVAIVDDDAFELWSLGSPLPPFETSELSVSDGDIVEVVGPAEIGEASDARGLAPGDDQSTYRKRPTALLFDGKPDDRLSILV